MTCLVIDDSKFARLMLTTLLEEYSPHSKIIQATNGLEAIQMVKEEKPDLIFIDLTMPTMDGYEAIPKLLKLYPNTHIAVITADIQEKAQQKVIELGAKMHIEKPINGKKIENILKIFENL
ncbi:response regulator [Sulfurimonas aquatica]|uniref:Response regulator n=1 Tax=Sulfurimonas aquatica TaxID=2672570 RepID=A0A975B2G6_9BACT|nr:response regulator [Sulfurimonas aquatica]QSZ43022.1 response regulator [Sulfurimonas aquatica]